MRLRFVFPRVPAVDGAFAIPTIPTRRRRDIGTIPIAHTIAALPHERPVTLTNRRTQMRKVSLIGNSLAYLLCQEAKRATEYRPGMTPEDLRVVSRMPDIRDIGTIPIAHTTAPPHERPVTNSLAYLLCQEAKRATEYRPGMTPEDVGAVSEKSVRQHETTKRAVRFSPRAAACAPGACPGMRNSVRSSRGPLLSRRMVRSLHSIIRTPRTPPMPRTTRTIQAADLDGRRNHR
jgi:hypothetical protein